MTQEKDIEQMFRRHYEKMYNLARCILSDDDESKDVVSEVFTQILADNIVLLPESEEGYLMRSVRNRCLNLIAHKSVKERVARLLTDDADVILFEDTDERLEQLLLLIDDLEPPIRKLIFRLRYLQDKSYKEVADEVGVSKVTVIYSGTVEHKFLGKFGSKSVGSTYRRHYKVDRSLQSILHMSEYNEWSFAWSDGIASGTYVVSIFAVSYQSLETSHSACL